MDYVINDVVVSVDTKRDSYAALIAYDMAYAAMKNERKGEKKNA